MKDLDFFQKGVIKFGMILLLGGLCMVGTISRSVAGEINSIFSSLCFGVFVVEEKLREFLKDN